MQVTLDHDPFAHLDRDRVMAAMVTLVESLASERAVCWVLEDLPWLYTATRDVAALVGRVVGGGRLLLVGTARTDPAEPDVLPETAGTWDDAPFRAS